MKIINYEKKKEMILLTDEEKETHENQEICYVCEKEFCTDENNKKEFKLKQKVRDHCHYTGKYRGAAHSNCNLNYKIPKEIPVVFHNGSTYDYHFIIKQFAREFKGNFDCLYTENTEKYITFSVPIKKEHDNGKTATYKVKFIDSYKFTQDSLLNLVDNLSEINNKFTDSTGSMTDPLIQSINKVSEIDKKISYDALIGKFYNTSQLCNKDFNKFALLLRKGVYPCEYMDSWNKFNEPVPLVENHYYSELNREGITKEDLKHVKKACDTFNIKNLSEYHDLYVQSDTALLADVFENFRNA